MKKSEFVDALRGRIQKEEPTSVVTYKLMSHYIAMAPQEISRWDLSEEEIRPQILANLIFRSKRRADSVAVSRAQQDAIRLVVEFFKLNQVYSRSNGEKDIFDKDTKHAYLSGLFAELAARTGIYVFHDSSGRALYVGKARKQELWKEINLAFNRVRTKQTLKRVAHPTINVKFKTEDERTRKIAPANVYLRDLAMYVSAYRVADGLIAEVEAILIRSFANDLRNNRMENFGRG